jgi:hypothetical protein
MTSPSSAGVPQTQTTPYANKALKLLLGVAAFLVCLHLIFQYINMEVFYQQSGQFYELSNRFDLDDESSLSTWYSQLLFFLIGIAALAVMNLEKRRPMRQLWKVIATIGILFSVDEIAGLHERLLQSIHVWLFKDNAPTGSANAWWVVLPFVLVVATWLGWKMLRLLPRRTTLLFIISGAVFISGAVIIDLSTNTVERETFLNQGIFVAVEESSELAGTVVALYAILAYIEKFHGSKLFAAAKELKTK